MSWVDGQVVTDWAAEIAKREKAIDGYLNDTDPARAARYGFRSGQNPQMAWSWFRDNPVGFNGVPYVLFKTILDLDPNHENPTLRAIARIWKREADRAGGIWNRRDRMDFRSHRHRTQPVRLCRWRRAARQPNGNHGFRTDSHSRTRARSQPLSAAETAALDARLLARRVLPNTTLLIAKVQTVDKEDNWERDRPEFWEPGCDGSRVLLVRSLPRRSRDGVGEDEVPSRHAEHRNRGAVLLEAADAHRRGAGRVRVRSGVDYAGEPGQHQANRSAIRALYTEMLDKARQQPETLYGSSPSQLARGKIQTLAVAEEFPSVMQDLIAVGVKTHFIYYVVAKNNAYKQPLPDVFEDRPGQMDAFGIASGLVAIHTRRPDNSFLEFVRRDNPNSPFFSGFSKANGLPADVPGMTERGHGREGGRGPDLQEYFRLGAAGPGADRRQERQLGDPSLSRQLGRQSGRFIAHPGLGSLRDGRPAHGQRAYSRAAEPVHRQSATAPLSLHERRFGAGARRARRCSRRTCATCHTPRNQTIYPVSKLGVDPNRTMVNTSVSRFGLAALVMEACTHLRLEQSGAAGRRVVYAEGRLAGATRRVLPRHAPPRGGGHQRLQGGHAARHLGSGAVSAQRIGSDAGPAGVPDHAPATIPSRERVLRRSPGRVRMVRLDPRRGTVPHDTILIKEYDTTVPGKANTGHTFGARPVPRYERPRSRRRSESDRRAPAEFTGRRVAGVLENAVGLKSGRESFPSHSGKRFPTLFRDRK